MKKEIKKELRREYFGVYNKDRKEAVAIFYEDGDFGLKMLMKMPRKWYYSAYNDMSLAWRERQIELGLI
jgi:hypothetical protein